MNILLLGEKWEILAHTLETLSSARKMTFVRPSEGSLRRAVADTEPSLILASTDFDYSRISRIKNGKNGESPLPPVLFCVTHESLESDDLYEGIDDVVVVPCSVAELDKRVRRLTSKGIHRAEASTLRVGPVVLDLVNYRVSVAGKAVRLAWMEFQLLKFLMQNPGRIFTREQLLTNVWDTGHFGQTRTVDVHVRRLRFKLGSNSGEFLRTVTNVGYGLVEPN